MNQPPLPRSTPEAQGVSSKAVHAFLAELNGSVREAHSVMLLRRGQVIAEAWWKPYAPDRPHMLFSLSKSFTSTAVGLALSERRLDLDDAVLSFFPEQAPKKVSQNLAAMKVRHLLAMVTGHASDTLERLHRTGGKNWVRRFLSLPVENAPGAPFVYNSGASYMLSAIIQKVTGEALVDYLRPRLFDPLGIHHPAWECCPGGINCGGWGLSLTTEEIARFGQLYLQDGVWNGQRVLPQGWVEQATRKQVENGTNPASDWNQGYGYQFWRCRHRAYRGDGAFGQFCVVLPEQQAVIVMTSGMETMQPALDLMWKHLLPALSENVLRENAAAQQQLDALSRGLAWLPPQGAATSPVAQKVSGKVYVVEPNPLKVSAVAFDFTEQGCRVSLTQGKRRRHNFSCGYGAWVEGSTSLTTRDTQAVIASGVWADDHTFVLTLRYMETPFTQTLTCRFAEDTVTIQPVMNLAFGPNEGPVLNGAA